MKNEDNLLLFQKVLEKKSRFGILKGDSKNVLSQFPDKCIDCVITSPPYWKMREYDSQDMSIIGNENDPKDYVNNLVEIFSEIHRVLTPEGSFWLNIGDKYYEKNLMGMPWRVAIALQDKGWILRNDVIWNQLKGTQSSKDRFRNIYQHLFHFVKRKKYYYDYKKILIKSDQKPTISNGFIRSATGVSGKKYKQQISESKSLSEQEKKNAMNALEATIERLKKGEIIDFRMTIRGQQRTLHSNTTTVSGRAKELKEKGFYIIQSHSEGFLPSDIWKIVPEDEWRTDIHYAVFPIELLEIPIKATCPNDGIVLDPFMGTGSTVMAALRFGCRGVGIEISQKYVTIAKQRINKNITLLDF
jgi:DNA modification methylase